VEVHPVGGGRRARWQFHVVHRTCAKRVAVGSSRIAPVDLLDVDQADPGQWLATIDH
jgi:hypothetical protein